MPITLKAQQLRITHLDSRVDLSFDLNRLYNYNSYEKSRWGGGLNLTIPLGDDSRYSLQMQNKLIASAYAGYGTGDKAWKWGAAAGVEFPRSAMRRLLFNYQHDLLRVGSHSFDEYNILNISNNSSYFSSHYCGVDRIAALALIDFPGPGMLWLSFDHSQERYLFDATSLRYPSCNEEDALPYESFNEVGFDLYWGKHWKFGMIANHRHDDQSTGDRFLPDVQFARFLAQYSDTIRIGNKGGGLSLYAQGGLLVGDVPVSRRFDLSGTGGRRYYFNNTFLTVAPNTFMGDAFATVCLRYTAGLTFWNTLFSKPRPFVQLNAMWGMLYDDTDDGIGDYLLTHTKMGNPLYITLAAPCDGLLEPAVGIDGLLQQGYLSLGVALAYQLTPRKAFYHSDNFSDNFAVMLTINIEFE